MEEKTFRVELQSGLADYRARNNITLGDLARELASNSAQVSQYLNGRPVGDVKKLEAVIEDVLHNESRRRASKHGLFECPISTTIRRTLDDIRETNDVGLIFGAAGIGKTCGIELYAAANPTAIAITAVAWRCVASDVEGMIFGSISHGGWKRDCKRGDWICKRLQGSNRLVIVDNAHRLRATGLAWLFDFHDQTDCPMALVGNPEVLDAIRQNDQQLSRIGIKRELRVKPGAADVLAGKVCKSLVPEAGSALDDIFPVVAERQGHFRSVRKLTNLARKIRENGDDKDWARCAKSAHSQLVRDYAL